MTKCQKKCYTHAANSEAYSGGRLRGKKRVKEVKKDMHSSLITHRPQSSNCCLCAALSQKCFPPAGGGGEFLINTG